MIAAAAGLSGVVIGGFFAAWNDRARRRAEFISRQLNEFYGPLVSLRAEILTLSKLRVKLQSAADATWRKLVAEERERGGATATRRLSEERFSEWQALTEDENRQLHEKLIPGYQKMVGTFRNRMWLAEPETRAYFGGLVEFVELWERHLRKTIPIEVLVEMEHTEEKLKPFYSHIEQVHDRLRGELAR